MMTVDPGQLDKEETLDLISAEKVQETPLFTPDGERAGSINTVMIDKKSGRVANAVMSSDGRLGSGEKLHALPWEVLTYDTALGGYRVDVEKSKLEGAPPMTADELADVEDRSWQSESHTYFGVNPFWR